MVMGMVVPAGQLNVTWPPAAIARRKSVPATGSLSAEHSVTTASAEAMPGNASAARTSSAARLRSVIVRDSPSPKIQGDGFAWVAEILDVHQGPVVLVDQVAIGGAPVLPAAFRDAVNGREPGLVGVENIGGGIELNPAAIGGEIGAGQGDSRIHAAATGNHRGRVGNQIVGIAANHSTLKLLKRRRTGCSNIHGFQESERVAVLRRRETRLLVEG